MFRKLRKRFAARQSRQAFFFLAFAMVMTLNVLPDVRAQALYLITDGKTSAVLDSTTTVADDRIIVTGAGSAGAEVVLTAGEKVTVFHGDTVDYATTRSGESVRKLLNRLKISMSPLEMAVVDISGEEITVEIASDFVYYETAKEAVAHTTIYTPAYDRPKGEVEVVQEGIDGTRDVVYEVVYADGQAVSRQAVSESNNTSVTELAYCGTLVSEVQPGDTILSVVHEEDDGGYLKMKSGDSIHFTGSMSVTCTAYTAGVGKVDTVTATGTTVHVGTVAVDRRVIPLGTKMFVVGSSGYTYGYAVAEDTGVRGAAVDVYLNTLEECIQFGRQKNSTVYFLD